jgi:hypothetical protein
VIRLVDSEVSDDNVGKVTFSGAESSNDDEVDLLVEAVLTTIYAML